MNTEIEIEHRSHYINFNDPVDDRGVSLFVATSGPGAEQKRKGIKPSSSVFISVAVFPKEGENDDYRGATAWMDKDQAEEFALSILAELETQKREDEERGTADV